VEHNVSEKHSVSIFRAEEDVGKLRDLYRFKGREV
jgi:hypothetical protein